MSATTILTWLQFSWLGEFMRHSGWLGATVSVVHVVALIFLLGAALAFDATVLGLDPDFPVPAAARLLLPVARVAFLIQASSGFFLFVGQARAVGPQGYFLAKLAWIAVALVNVALFHLRAGRHLRRLPPGPAPGWARVMAVLSLVSWTTVAGLGCLIVYP